MTNQPPAKLPRDESDAWPIKHEFWVSLDEHCEDGNWSGYAWTDDYFPQPMDMDSFKAVTKSYADRMEQELAFVKTQWKQTSDLLEQERNRLTEELADVRKERDKEQRQANVLAIALSTYRNHQFCECGVEGCGDCAEDCSVRAYVDGELLAYQAWRSGEG